MFDLRTEDSSGAWHSIRLIDRAYIGDNWMQSNNIYMLFSKSLTSRARAPDPINNGEKNNRIKSLSGIFQKMIGTYRFPYSDLDKIWGKRKGWQL